MIDSRVEAQFVAAMSRRGLVPKKLIADGKIHRCDVRGPGGCKDGAYLLYVDGVVPAGGFQNWKDGLGWAGWSFDVGRQLTPAEQSERQRKIDRARDESPPRMLATKLGHRKRPRGCGRRRSR
jgi:putative DNA primase/helicase